MSSDSFGFGPADASERPDRSDRMSEFTHNPAFMGKPNRAIVSKKRIWLLSGITALAVFLLALALQWIIYDRILHQDGLRFVGSVVSAIFAAVIAYLMKMQARRARIAELRRLETIALMNHHIRNSLQAIVYCSGTSEYAATIRQSVDRIEWVLSEVVPGVNTVDDSADG